MTATEAAPGRKSPAKSPLKSQQRAVLALLVAGRNITSAARETGVSDRSIRRWLATEAFRAELDRQQEGALAEARGILRGNAAAASTSLVRSMALASQANDGEALRRASATLLELVIRLSELDLSDRIRVLELKLAEQPGARR